MKWRHNSSFSGHHQVRIKPEDEKGIENLSQYIYYSQHFFVLRYPICRGDGNSVVPFEDEPWKEQKNFQIFDPLEFIAAITQHIPEKSFQLVRYYGWYSNRMRGDRKKQGQAVQAPD